MDDGEISSKKTGPFPHVKNFFGQEFTVVFGKNNLFSPTKLFFAKKKTIVFGEKTFFFPKTVNPSAPLFLRTSYTTAHDHHFAQNARVREISATSIFFALENQQQTFLEA